LVFASVAGKKLIINYKSHLLVSNPRPGDSSFSYKKQAVKCHGTKKRGRITVLAPSQREDKKREYFPIYWY